MGDFTVELPFALILQEDLYPTKVRGVDMTIEHALIQQNELDPRLGGISGSFGFQKDPAGVLRYSVLTFSVDDSQLQSLERSFFGDLLRERGTHPSRIRAKVALAICNYFIDVYRSITQKPWVEPVEEGALAFVHYQDSSTSDEVRLYGGGITLPPAGLAPDALHALRADLASGTKPPAYRLANLDALRTAERGAPNGALVSAVGALESALDTFFATRWRGNAPATTVDAAKTELGVKTTNLRTIDDVLKAGTLRRKLIKFNKLASVDYWEEEGVSWAIEARNDAVHGGIAIPVSLAMDHIVTIGQFLDARIGPAIQALPKPIHPRILDAYTEATGTTAPAGLESIVARYLIDRDLDAVLYSDDPKWSQGPRTNRYGRSLVIRFPLHDPSMTPDRVALLLARMIMFFALSTTGMTPRGRVGELPPGWNPAGYEVVASELTRAVWEIGIDQALAAEGFAGTIRSDIDERANQLLKQFGAPYSPPASLSAQGFTEHFELARIAAALGEHEQEDLLGRVGHAAPTIAVRARQALPKLLEVELKDPNTVRNGLVALHDAAGLLLGSVVVFDPTTGQSYGAGLTSN